MAHQNEDSRAFPNDSSQPGGPGDETLPAGVVAFEATDLVLLDAVIHYFDSARWMDRPARVLILDLRRLSTIDRWGARTVRLLGRLCRGRRTVLLLSGLRMGARVELFETGVIDEIGSQNVFTRWQDAVARAGVIVAGGIG
jgi:hypothetical protein